MECITVKALFSGGNSIAWELFEKAEYPWAILSDISDFILKKGGTLPRDKYQLVGDNVWIARDASVAPSASISGPAIIDSGAEIRHCAYIRGSAIVGKGAVVGNSCELKNCILFDGVQVPHFNYVGDSVLGYKAHMGAGAVTSNVKSDKSQVDVKYAGGRIETGRRKLGAMIGDFAEIGCNSVLCPGSVIGKNTTVYPASCVRGYIPADSIYKNGGVTVEKKNM